MKYIYIFAFFVCLCLLSSLIANTFFDKSMFWFDNDDKYLLVQERAVNEIQHQTASFIKKKYKLDACGLEVSMPNGVVKGVGIAFDSPNRLSKEELTKLLFAFGEELLKNINANQDLQMYLDHRPFTLKDVAIIIYNNNLGRIVYDPEITVARLSDGLVIFRTKDPEKEFGYKSNTTEKYEDVLKRLQSENSEDEIK